jgi:hypothetical protein
VSPIWLTTLPASILGAATTFHVALLVLRQHRSVHSLGSATILLPSLVLAATPWFFPARAWVATGIAAHLAWFAACEKLLPKKVAARPGAQSARVAVSTPSPAAPAPAPHRPAPAFQPVPVLAVFEETEDIKTFRARPGRRKAAGALLLDQLGPAGDWIP